VWATHYDARRLATHHERHGKKDEAQNGSAFEQLAAQASPMLNDPSTPKRLESILQREGREMHRSRATVLHDLRTPRAFSPATQEESPTIQIRRLSFSET
jgi:hypothetical protein